MKNFTNSNHIKNIKRVTKVNIPGVADYNSLIVY